MAPENPKLPVSVFIVAQDESQHLPRLMASLSAFAEIIVVDSGSSDDTPKIATDFGATVIHQPWLGYAGQKQFALEQCSQEWVLNLDADEVVTEPMLTAIKQAIAANDCDAVRFNRNDLFIGKMPPATIKKPNNVRFYRRSKAAFDVNQKVHETAKCDGTTLCVEAAFDHYGYDQISVLMDKLNTYSSLKAEQKYAKGKSASLFKLILIGPIEFVRKLFLQRMIFFGRRGLILAALNAHYAFLKEAKLLELHLRKHKD
ncbi:glycosyltransferase family 2 protein [Alteromonas sp. ASW11-36]|uniref:Glycosyltransferase family 2 protein n=1 Tax=Alteromonas arenosi TaxID=3055817 RepID=A0ABT7SSX5_9ALTE|nr:glycosyltransferase family 2 protein [Alteromonas sp. ASW11-36]MDM7859275.1 glycosyltransferase family 2 protein [Alteromonas sp. ASW11-36]